MGDLRVCLREWDGGFTEVIARRRWELVGRMSQPIVLFAGDRLGRNFRANPYPFRANSHFLYFAGLPLPGAVLYLGGDRQILFFDFPEAGDALWHGEFFQADALQEYLAVDQILPCSQLENYGSGAVTIPLVDPYQRLLQGEILGRVLPEPEELEGGDRQLVEATIQLRLSHDSMAIAQIQQAISISTTAHLQGMKTAPQVKSEAAVRAAIEAAFTAEQMGAAYTSIVSTQGEVLHIEFSPNLLKSGDLLLVDAGAETVFGWASDITRTYPVSGKFSVTQRAIYGVVLAAHDQAIAAMRPGIEFRDLHHLALRVITEGLRDLGILRGNVEDLLQENIAATFFPHGLGHLLGLDVHDMEDLGDRAGYAPGRKRSEKFGECFLRLDRPLQENMIVTVEPGFYQVPKLLGDRRQQEPFRSMIHWETLEKFQDVRGIRIENDILITKDAAHNLSQNLPTTPADIEDMMNS